MKALLFSLVVLCLVLTPGVAVAQSVAGSGWSWVLPSDMPHESVDFVSRTEAWSTGMGRTLLHSVDGGATWTASLMPCDPRAMDFVDGSHGWAAGGVATVAQGDPEGVVWRTVDGGTTWTRTTMPGVESLTGVAFADAQHGCVMTAHGTVARTVDGGVNWTTSAVQSGGSVGLWDIAMPDPSHVWVVGRRSSTQAAVFASSDGGQTWRQQLGAVPADVTDISMDTASSGWCSARTHVLHTSDGGADWSIVDPAQLDYNQWTLLATMGGSHAWVTVWPSSDTNPVYATDDGGTTWRQLPPCSPPPSSFGQVHAFSAEDLVGFGSVAGEWTSGDGGDTWTQVVAGGSQQYTADLSFISPSEGWAATPYSREGEIRHTTDGGQTWSGVMLPPEGGDGGMFAPLVVQFTDRDHGCAIGDGYSTGAALAVTSDGGETWTRRAVPAPKGYAYQPSLYGMDFAGWKAGWAAGGDGAVIRTVDGGRTWERVRGLDGKFASAWQDVAALSASRCCLVGTLGKTGAAALTTDGGRTWRFTKLPGMAGRSLLSVAFTDALHGWAGGPQGMLFRTSNGGTTWKLDGRKVMSAPVADLAFGDSRHGWLLGNGLVWRTADGGASWRPQTVELPFAECIAAVGAETCCVGGEQGVIRTSTAGAPPDGAAAPATAVERPAGTWHNGPVLLAFTARPSSSGYLSTICDISGSGTYVAPGSLVIDPREGRSLEGGHSVTVVSLAPSGLGGPSSTFRLGFDTRLPDTYALAKVRVSKGATARFPYRIKDATPGSGSARTRFVVFDRDGKVLKEVSWGVRRANVRLTGSFRCSLPKGTYGWMVAAVDLAGNKTDKAYYSLLTVTSGTSSSGVAPATDWSRSSTGAPAGWMLPDIPSVRALQR